MIFSEGLHDLGKIHLMTNHTDTLDAPPVKLPPNKQTSEMRRVTQQYVEDFKRNDVIKESNSSWHSPVVLVKKANSDEYRFAVDNRKFTKSVSHKLIQFQDFQIFLMPSARQTHTTFHL